MSQEKFKFKVGQIVESVVIGHGTCGEGIIDLDGFLIFVPGAISGERVKVRLNYVKNNIANADLIDVLSVSNDRIKPRCVYYDRCGGCDMQHIKNSVALDIKHQNVSKTLCKISKINFETKSVVSLNEWEYRNKLSLPFGINPVSKNVFLGFYEKRSHNIVKIKHCALNGEWASRLIRVVSDWANKYGISVYNERTNKGLLRHLVARQLDTLQATLVINGSSVEHIDDLALAIEKEFGQFALYISVNRKNTNVIMGDTVRLVAGSETPQKIGRFQAILSPLSFLQVNDVVKSAIYDRVVRFLSDFDGDIVELYSGVGLLTADIALSLPNSKIKSVEIVPDAVKNARQLMKNLKIDSQVECICDDASRAIAKLGNDSQGTKFAIVVDPPRKGLHESVAKEIAKSDFDLLAYISCNPSTLARDLALLFENAILIQNGKTIKSVGSENDLIDAGIVSENADIDDENNAQIGTFSESVGKHSRYQIDLVEPYDMFPNTSHVETLVLARKLR